MKKKDSSKGGKNSMEDPQKEEGKGVDFNTPQPNYRTTTEEESEPLSGLKLQGFLEELAKQKEPKDEGEDFVIAKKKAFYDVTLEFIKNIEDYKDNKGNINKEKLNRDVRIVLEIFEKEGILKNENTQSSKSE